MEQVVEDMSLNVTYYRKGRVKNTELYKSPVMVKIVSAEDTIKETNIDIELLKNNQASVSSKKLDTLVSLDKPFKVPCVGTILISRNAGVEDLYSKYRVNITSIDSKVADFMEDLTVEVKNKLITIVDVSLNHPIPKKGEDILNQLITSYVQGNVKDKNEIADSTVKFIQNRLSFIGKELGDLEGNIQGFKQKNNLADMTEQSKLLVQTTGQYVSDLSKMETQISILKSLQEYLKDGSKNKRVLPSSLVPADLVFSSACRKI